MLSHRYQKGFEDGLKGKPTAWLHITDMEYAEGYRFGSVQRIKKEVATLKRAVR